MNTVPAMKLVAHLSRLAALGFAAFLLGLALDTQALALFSFATSAFLLLLLAQDYAPRRSYGRSRAGTVVTFTPVPVRATQPGKIAA